MVLAALSCLFDVVLQCSVVRSANLPIKKDHCSWLSRWPCQTGSDRAYWTTKYTIISLFCFVCEAVVNESHWGWMMFFFSLYQVSSRSIAWTVMGLFQVWSYFLWILAKPTRLEVCYNLVLFSLKGSLSSPLEWQAFKLILNVILTHWLLSKIWPMFIKLW